MLEFEEDVSVERRNRIRLSVAAFAYEYHDDPIMSDAEFDDLSKRIDKNKKTGNSLLDEFFANHFDPSTGMWIRQHPEQDALEWIYQRLYKDRT